MFHVAELDLDAKGDKASWGEVDVLLEHVVEEEGLEGVFVGAGEVDAEEAADAGDGHSWWGVWRMCGGRGC